MKKKELFRTKSNEFKQLNFVYKQILFETRVYSENKRMPCK